MPRKQKKRTTKKTVLIATNGQVTERTYLNEVKKRAHLLGDVSVTVTYTNGDPEGMLRKLKSTRDARNNASAYDEVWLVFDEDGRDCSSLFFACEKLTTKRQRWSAAVSRPCFEVWLIAHYEQVHNYSDQTDAQKHFRQLTPGTPDKHLPNDFPYDRLEDAVKRCTLQCEAQGPREELPPIPGSGMPHLLDALGLIKLSGCKDMSSQ